MTLRRHATGLFFALCILAAGQACAETEPETGRAIEWMSFEEAIMRNDEQPRKILVDIYTDWCSWCKVMDDKVFSDPLITRYMGEHFYAVKLNGEHQAPIRFRGKEYAFRDSLDRPCHQLAAELLEGRVTYPAYVILDEKLNVAERIRGYKEAPHFYGILAYLAGGDYQAMDFESFMKKHKSPYPYYSYEESKPRLISH